MTQNDKIKEELEGKRLLILGGGEFKDAIKMVTDTYGISLIAAGNDKYSDMFSIAKDKYYVDSTDSDLMRKLIVDQHIDGVFMGASEPVIASACKYLHELGFPCYCTYDQWEIIQNKKLFKKLCAKHGLPIVPQYELNKSEIQGFTDFPVIIKPANSSGSRGVRLCHNKKELCDGYEKATINSTTGEVLVEQYVNNDAVEVFYTICNGKLYFSGLEDKYPVKFEEQQSYVGGLFTFDSSLVKEFREKFERKIAELVSDIGIEQGNLWMEVFKDGDNYYFNEAGFRYGGEVTVYPVDYLHNINQVANDIYYAITGKGLINGFPSLIPDKFPRGKKYAVYPVFAHAGTICDIKGVDAIKQDNRIIYVILRKHIGQTIQETGAFSQIVVLVHFLYESEEELKTIIKDIHTKIQLIDQDGKNMVYEMLNLEDIQLR